MALNVDRGRTEKRVFGVPRRRSYLEQLGRKGVMALIYSLLRRTTSAARDSVNKALGGGRLEYRTIRITSWV